MSEYTPHQKKVIERYYDRRDEIMLARLGEIVSDLYLADTDAKLNRLWKRAEAAMKGLKVPEGLIQHILTQRKPEILADNLKNWLAESEHDGGRNKSR
ncbi:MAG: hypothetical protein JSV78_03035 [Phycisphaerales bacterium]|nr:MAG: hypothetical protein JSV78_03035 [Phycisphaerales bacterium]